MNEDIDDLLDDESPELSNDEESVVDELINSPVKNSNLNIFTKDDSTTMKTLNNEEFILSIANSLEVTKPNSIQGLEGKVTSDRMCDHEEAFKVDNTGVYEHGKITPLSVNKPDGAIGNMTVEDEYDNHTWITKGVTKNNNAVSTNVPATTYFLDFTCRKCDNPMAKIHILKNT